LRRTENPQKQGTWQQAVEYKSKYAGGDAHLGGGHQDGDVKPGYRNNIHIF